MLQNLGQKLKNKHFLSLTTSVVMSACGMLTYMLLLRSMHAEQMGYWIFFQTAFMLLDTLRTGFLQTALIKFYSGAEKERAAEVMGSVWFLAFVITAFWLILTIPGLFLLPFIKDNSIKIVIEWFAFIFILTLPSTISTWRLQSDQKFDKLLYLGLVTQGSFLVLIIVLIVTSNMNITNLLYADALVYIISSSVCLVFGWSGIRFFAQRTKETIKEVYHFGKFSVGTSISTNLLRSSDIFMINFLLGPALLPVYNVAQRLMEAVEIPLRSFLVTGMPELSTAFNQKKNDDVVSIMKKYSGMLTLVLIPVAIVGISLADVAVAILGGGKYVGTDAANVFRVFMLLSIVYPIDRFTGVTLDIIHQPKRNFIKVIIMLVINVIANYIGIKLFGNLYGVVFSSVLSFSVGVCYSYFSLKEFLSFNVSGILKTGFYELKYLYLKVARG